MVDLNLVKVFITIFDTKSVSLAATKLNITQPSVSHSLSRLRYIFNEQLFIRTKEGMIPTFYAMKLYEVLNKPMIEIENALKDIKDFDPQKSDACFKLALMDTDGFNILPVLLSQLEKAAPNISLEIVAIEINKVLDWLRIGKIDAVICHQLILDKNVMSFKLFTEKYICMVTKKNQLLNYKLTFNDFLLGNHAIHSNSTMNDLIDDYLSQRGLQRKIKLKVSQSGHLDLYAGTHNLMMIRPLRVGRYSKHDSATSIFDLPMDLPTLDMTLHWHKKSRDTSAHQWFIAFLKEVLRDN